jgi:excisionase family DNA binding protein
MPPTFLDAHELAKRLNVSYGTVTAWARRGKVPFIQAERRRYIFNLNSVIDALRSQPHKSNGHPKAEPRQANPMKDKTAKGLDSTN